MSELSILGIPILDFMEAVNEISDLYDVEIVITGDELLEMASGVNNEE